MRRSVVRLIAFREFRDQLRDRRTLFLLLGMPLLMYPLFVGVAVLFAKAAEKKLLIGVVGIGALPQGQPAPDLSTAARAAAAAAAGTTAAVARDHMRPYPPLIVEGQFAPEYLSTDINTLGGTLVVVPVESADEEQLRSRKVDVLLVIEPDLLSKLERGEKPTVRVLGREGEENSKLAVRRLTDILRRWKSKLKEVRFLREGLPADFDAVVEVKDPQSEKSTEKKIAEEIRDALVKVLPFLVVMWMLTGCIYPAIDMTAGEKERGTMETLLISPAERSEIVMGKFLATTILGFSTAVWNVLLLLIAVSVAQMVLKSDLLSLPGLAMGVLAAIPLAMLFAALCLSLGIFARSTKEGNYYMVPLFFVVLPLTYYSMAPGIELDSMTSWVPLTNALLLQQRLMANRPDPFPWQHVPAVVLSLTACVAAALTLAVLQFKRESVLFREAQVSGRKGLSLFRRRV